MVGLSVQVCRIGEGLHRFKGLHCVKDANIQAFLVSSFSACSTSTDSVYEKIQSKISLHIGTFCHFAQSSSVDIIQVEASTWDIPWNEMTINIYIYIYIYIYICKKFYVCTYVCIYIYVLYIYICIYVCYNIYIISLYDIITERFFEVALELAWVGFEPMTTEFCSDTLTDWAIRPWVQLALRPFFQSYSTFIICSISDFISANAFISRHVLF